MSGNFLQPLPVSEAKQKMVSMGEMKIKSLESRLMGPNSDGKLPTECDPLKESEIENIKSKILLNENNIQHDESKNNSNTLRKNSNKSNSTSKKRNSSKTAFDYLMNKRVRETMMNDANKNFSSTQDKNENVCSEIFSSKHCSTSNNLFNSGMKNKNIIDYYGKQAQKRETEQKNNNSSNKNIKNFQEKKENNSQDLASELKEKNRLLNEKDRQIEKLKQLLTEKDETIAELQNYKQCYELEIKKCRYDICTLVKENEEYKRQNRKRDIHERELKIGRNGPPLLIQGKLYDSWEDGEDLLNVKRKLEEIKNEKEELEKQRRKLSANRARSKANTSSSSIEHSTEHELEQNMRDVLSFKWNSLIKQENELKETKEKLELETVTLRHDISLYNQELKCSFGKKKDGWPLLAGRYQIVGLLGKGGYSEVYKAYDLEEHMVVACKLHQLNQNWKEEIKDNYIKHTIRENQIHKEIDFSKIVKHYGTIEIDNNSFCTVLEYCTGPDLATYLQKNKSIGEKEARIIITQILLGLEYLNKLPNKIIHYDLKPENIIFHNMEVKISDFGLAKIIENNADKIQLTSQGVGTYWYLPPECFEENFNVDISSKVDIFSVGVILYEMFFRVKPFGQNYTQDKLLKDKIMYNARKVEFPPKPVISEECKDFIKHCLASRQEDRYDVFQALNSPFIRQDKDKNKTK